MKRHVCNLRLPAPHSSPDFKPTWQTPMFVAGRDKRPAFFFVCHVSCHRMRACVGFDQVLFHVLLGPWMRIRVSGGISGGSVWLFPRKLWPPASQTLTFHRFRSVHIPYCTQYILSYGMVKAPLFFVSNRFVRLKGRFFYRMVDDSLPQWIRTYPVDAAPRTGDGLFPGEVIEVTQVCVVFVLESMR